MYLAQCRPLSFLLGLWSLGQCALSASVFRILKDDRLSKARLGSSFRVVGTYSGNGLPPCSHPFGFHVLFFNLYLSHSIGYFFGLCSAIVKD